MKMRTLVAILPPLALAGCSLAPRTDLPPPPVPQSWPVGDAYLMQSEAALPVISYSDIFRDPALRALVELALANNRDLRVAAANVAAARAQARATRAELFPEITVGGSVEHTDRSGAEPETSYAVSGGVSSFELDLFGKLANASEAERNRALATEAAARAVRLGLVADLVNAWAGYAADRDLLIIAEETAANARDSVRLTRARLEGGVAPRTDLRQAEQILASAEGDIARQKTALAQDENLVRLLVGSEFDTKLLPTDMGQVVGNTEVLPAGTNSQVLLRRPDIVQAEYLLRAANADIGAARAALFPSISLTGLLGFASDALATLFDSAAFSKTIGGAASLAIFDGGKRSANIVAAQADRDAALANYEGAIQNAFREVADALADQGTVGDRLKAAQAYREAAADNAMLADARYRGGVDSYLANLDAQRSLFAARQAEVAVQLEMVRNRVTLYRVLGGDQASPAN
ncbi:transporter [Croceicoccus estronivorus]|uniref:efflux transporter outer membrane subunit n=1 Tax=Croceicoccus estronivorus TaxID=1172626 RepID=UPI000829EEAF|nr:efflux transporter outer membrane subunit [Croceicoccus estronivorus]OCC24162.1 transporter [Croceicoccus estronivorus]